MSTASSSACGVLEAASLLTACKAAWEPLFKASSSSHLVRHYGQVPVSQAYPGAVLVIAAVATFGSIHILATGAAVAGVPAILSATWPASTHGRLLLLQAAGAEDATM